MHQKSVRKKEKKRLLTRSVIALSLKILGAIFVFTSTVVIGRLLGLESAGTYFLSLSVVAVTTIFCRFGFDNVVLKEIAQSELLGSSTKSKPRSFGEYQCVITITLISSMLVTYIVFHFADYIGVFFKNIQMVGLLKIMSLSLIPLAVLNINAVSLRAIGEFELSVLTQDVMMPALMVVFGGPLMYAYGLQGAGFAYLVSATLTMAVSTWFWSPSVDGWRLDIVILRRLWVGAKHLFPATLITRGLIPFSPVLALGLLSSAEQVGIFSAISRLAMIVTLVLAAVGGIVAPSFSRLFGEGNITQLEMLFKRSAQMTSILVIPVCVFMAILAPNLLSLFGAEFIVGTLALQILLIARSFAACFGAQDQLLMMASKEKYFKVTTTIGAIVLSVLLLSLIPNFGSAGAAVATGVTIVLTTVLNSYFVSTKIGVRFFALGLVPISVFQKSV